MRRVVYDPIHLVGPYFIEVVPNYETPVRKYLPKVSAKVHATIHSTAVRTCLRQIYTNPFRDKALEEIKYAFPLYDGISVVEFTCKVGDRVIQGVVKEKDSAKAIYEEAKDRGETAGLLEQLPSMSDVFVMSLGNLPANEKIIVDIAYVGELNHDAEVDGTRLTIPTKIAPRYGDYGGHLLQSSVAQDEGMQVIVDVIMDETCPIQKIQSPSHPISVNIGTLHGETLDSPTLTRGSATLSRGKTELDGDFVLQIVSGNTGVPCAMVETHSSIPNSKALMATLVPKFSLKQIRPEIIFVVDRSGSMRGNISTLVAAMEVFLRSLPVGVKFNICSFGSSYEFLWEKSQSYNQQSLDQASTYVRNFLANFGGTETFSAVKAAIGRRFTDIPTEIMLLTDGQISDQNQLFDFLNAEIQKSNGSLRLFSFGIGSAASHALIQGVARAGNGFGQHVSIGEAMDSKIVRMLKGALTPHINDYSLEVKYRDDDSPEDFEIIEKVTDGFNLNLNFNGTGSDEKSGSDTQKPISLFDTSADAEKGDQEMNGNQNDRFAHLPPVPPPKLLQTPHQIPPLFPFSRTTVYLLMSPELSHLIPTSVTLRATSSEGLLELEIPVQSLQRKGQTIHQLAAKKAVQELEEGRGWLVGAKDDKGIRLKDKHPSRFDEIVHREAVRLGEQFQVAGKWCSFVAVQDNEIVTSRDAIQTERAERETLEGGNHFARASPAANKAARRARPHSGFACRAAAPLMQNSMQRKTKKSLSFSRGGPESEPVNYDTASAESSVFGSLRKGVGGLFGGGAASQTTPRTARQMPQHSEAAHQDALVASLSADPTLESSGPFGPPSYSRQIPMQQNSFVAFDAMDDAAPQPVPPGMDGGLSLVRKLINLQHFTGAWDLAQLPTIAMQIDDESVQTALNQLKLQYKASQKTESRSFETHMEDVLATALVVRFLEEKMSAHQDVWELVVDKGKSYVMEVMNDTCDGVRLHDVWNFASIALRTN